MKVGVRKHPRARNNQPKYHHGILLLAFLIVALPTPECQAGFHNLWSLTFFMTNALLKQDLRTLINSHLFCVDNLSDTEIRERLTRDGPPVYFEGQHILGYHWFAYPNAAEGLYSKVLERVNMFGDLVVGSGEERALCVSSTAGFR